MSKCTQVNCAEIALLELLEAGVLIAQLDDEWSGAGAASETASFGDVLKSEKQVGPKKC